MKTRKGCLDLTLYVFGTYTVLAYVNCFSYYYTVPLLVIGTLWLYANRSVWHALGYVLVHLVLYAASMTLFAYWLAEMAIAYVYNLLAPLQPIWNTIHSLRQLTTVLMQAAAPGPVR